MRQHSKENSDNLRRPANQYCHPSFSWVKSWRSCFAGNTNGALTPCGSYTELTTEWIPLHVVGLGLRSVLNPKVSVFVHHLTSSALSIAKSLLLRSKCFTSLAHLASGMASMTVQLLLNHFNCQSPPLKSRHCKSPACCKASSVDGKDFRLLST